MFFHKNCYSKSVKLLSKQGYSFQYIEMLKKECEQAKSKTSAAEGQGYLCSAYLFRGELNNSAETFEKLATTKVKALQRELLFSNMMLCYFIMGKNQKADEIFRQYNDDILRNNGVLMKRSIAIHEYIQGRYENAVTILIKLINEDDRRATLFIDFCLIKTFLKLKMFERAYEFSATLDKYDDKHELTKEVAKIKKIISDNIHL